MKKRLKKIDWARWRKQLAEISGLEMDAPDPDQFRAWTRYTKIGGLVGASTVCTENVGSTDRQTIRRNNSDLLTVQILEAGQTVLRMNGIDAVGGPGDILLRDWTRPHEIASISTEGELKRAKVINLPRSFLASTLEQHSDPNGLLLSKNSPAARVTRAFLINFEDCVHDIDPSYAPGFANMALDMLNNALLLAKAPESDRQAQALAHVKSKLKSHIGDPDLPLQKLSSLVGMSPRKLQRLFQAEGTTPFRWIEEQRLNAIVKRLKDPKDKRTPFTELALSNGFNDFSTFSRAFKRRYGVNPSEYRARLHD